MQAGDISLYGKKGISVQNLMSAVVSTYDALMLGMLVYDTKMLIFGILGTCFNG